MILRSCLRCTSLASLLLAFFQLTHAANPIFPGFADPAITVHGGRMYIAVGKDGDPKAKGFVMPYWTVFSSTDLVTWREEKRIDPDLVSYLGKGYKNCWASDITFRNGQFYFYFSAHNRATGVLVADAPNGTYRDVLRHPLVSSQPSDQFPYDPTVFTDDDGATYLVFGRDGKLPGQEALVHYRIARLNPDLVSLAEAPRDLLTDQPYGFGSPNRATDHSYLHKHGGLYYLSRDQTYMTARSVYGPYSHPRNTGQPGHSSFATYNGQWYHAYEFTDDRYNVRTYRQTMMTYLHYRENGDMVDDRFFLKGGAGYAYGVGNYDAGWPRIEAEWFFAISGAEKQETSEGGFEVRARGNGGYVQFPSVRNIPEDAEIEFRVACAGTGAGQIEVHAGSPAGAKLATVEIPGGTGPLQYQVVRSRLEHAGATGDLCVVFAAGADLHFDWMRIRPAGANAAAAP